MQSTMMNMKLRSMEHHGTTEVMVGEPVSITLSTPHNYAAEKLTPFQSEIFGSPTNYVRFAY